MSDPSPSALSRMDMVRGPLREGGSQEILMAFWLFVECRWCGYTGCAPPVDDRCPQCLRALEPEPVPAPAPPAPTR
jgi:hypothetical protein